MPIITQISPQTVPERVNIYLDNKFTIGTSQAIANELNLSLNQKYTEKELKKLIRDKEKELETKEFKITKITQTKNPRIITIQLGNQYPITLSSTVVKELNLKQSQIWTKKNLKEKSLEVEDKITKIIEKNNKVSIYLNDIYILSMDKNKASQLKIGQTWTIKKLKQL
ncbi:MAG: hypothetical protein ACRC1M_06125, partial [Methanobacteriaceae archaeon]